MIEIKELVIRANVDDSSQSTGERPARETSDRERTGCCQENLDLLLKLIKEKNER